jgi:hypothetical protein
VGPDLITDPAFLVTRNMEDFITWVDTSKLKRHIQNYAGQVELSSILKSAAQASHSEIPTVLLIFFSLSLLIIFPFSQRFRSALVHIHSCSNTCFSSLTILNSPVRFHSTFPLLGHVRPLDDFLTWVISYLSVHIVILFRIFQPIIIFLKGIQNE